MGDRVRRILTLLRDGHDVMLASEAISLCFENENLQRRISMSVATAQKAASLGCPSNLQSTVATAGIDESHLNELAGIKGFSWTALVAFIQKWGPLAPQIIAAFSGGLAAFAAFALAHAADMPAIIADFMAIFA